MANAVVKILKLRRAADITMKRLEWLWPNRIPLGKITILCGIPGQGKSLASNDLAARVTTGSAFPDAPNPLPPSDVLFVSTEDDPEDSAVPRLIAAGADLSRIPFVESVSLAQGGLPATERDLFLDQDVSAIRDHVTRHPAIRLIIIDPISNHLGGAKMSDEQQIRKLLRPLRAIAAEFRVSIVCVMHLNKKEDLDAINRVGGAGAFIGLPRASWLFANDKKDDSRHIMAPLKNNYAPSSVGGLTYRIEKKPIEIEGAPQDVPYIVWGERVAVDADSLLASTKGGDDTKFEQAKEFLRAQLSSGPKEGKLLYRAASDLGISERTLERVKRALGGESRVIDGCRKWVIPAYEPVSLLPATGAAQTDAVEGQADNPDGASSPNGVRQGEEWRSGDVAKSGGNT